MEYNDHYELIKRIESESGSKEDLAQFKELAKNDPLFRDRLKTYRNVDRAFAQESLKGKELVFFQKKQFWVAAAASILLAFGFAYYFINTPDLVEFEIAQTPLFSHEKTEGLSYSSNSPLAYIPTQITVNPHVETAEVSFCSDSLFWEISEIKDTLSIQEFKVSTAYSKYYLVKNDLYVLVDCENKKIKFD